MIIKKQIQIISKYLLLGVFIHTFSACGQTDNKKAALEKNGTDSFIVKKTDEEWKNVLSADQYYILRKKGTEEPYSGKLLLNKEKGIYKCAGCGNNLFTDDMKFDSHCGWPSFDKEIAGGKIKTLTDNSHGMQRIEIQCANCGGHLGHLFDDGPTETGMRYCVNSLSLEFVSENELKQEGTISKNKNTKKDTIVLGGGCFWCVEAVYEMLEGVVKVESGYAGGKVVNPTYKEVCSGTTGHAEVVSIVYDNSKIDLTEILKVFFTVHDPTTLNRQGADAGTQYRSVVFYKNEIQKAVINNVIEALQNEKVFESPIVTQVVPFTNFYVAENYHQDYFELNKQEPYCEFVIQPKIDKMEKVFKDKLKK
ncbi:MAG: bifunctional methionine sulfoxide reductase B/A protein [Bacteroidia bacterium]